MTATDPPTLGSVRDLREVLAYLRDLHRWLDWAPVAVCPVREPVEGLKVNARPSNEGDGHFATPP